MITKITVRPFPTTLAILSAICVCVLLNGRITPSGKYELMANLGLKAYQNLANKNIEWVKNDKIIGVRLQSGNGAKELFVGVQKGLHFKPQQEAYASHCSRTQTLKLANEKQFNHELSIGGLSLRMKILFYSQKATDGPLNYGNTDEKVTNLNYVYKKCSKNKMVILDYDKTNHPPLEEEQAISKFGLLIQILRQ